MLSFSRFERTALLYLLISQRESQQVRHEEIIPAKDIASLVSKEGQGAGTWMCSCTCYMNQREPGKWRRVKGRATQNKVSLRTRERDVLTPIAKANRSGLDQLAKLKAIQCYPKLLLRQTAQALGMPSYVRLISLLCFSRRDMVAS